MPDTIHSPLGEIPKKWAITGGIGVVLGAALYYRHFQAKQAAASAASAGANSGIDPATGYAYGSAEDAAALGAQSSYINPTVGSGGGGTVAGTPAGGTGLPQAFGSNAQWVQYVVGFVQNNQTTSDNGTTMQTALGVYITGGIPTTDQTSLINQAIAIAGYPPIAGTNGYPPHINTQNVGSVGTVDATILDGNHVTDWLAGHHVTLPVLLDLNPDLAGKISYSNARGWISPTNPNHGDAVQSFYLGGVPSITVKIPQTS